MNWLAASMGVASLISLAAIAGCTGDVVEGQGGGDPACTPGRQITCTCPGGSISSQRCNADGSGYGACLCGGEGGSGPSSSNGPGPTSGPSSTNGPGPTSGPTSTSTSGPGPTSTTGSGPSTSSANPVTSSSSGQQGCNIPDGDYVLYFSVPLSPQKPIIFFAEATTTSSSAGPKFALSIHTAHQSGGEQSQPALIGPGGDITVHFPAVTVPAEDDPIAPGSAIEASNVVLTGSLCPPGGRTCGEATGNVTAPIATSLAGATWTMQPLTTPLPTEYIDCAGNIGQ